MAKVIIGADLKALVAQVNMEDQEDLTLMMAQEVARKAVEEDDVADANILVSDLELCHQIRKTR